MCRERFCECRNGRFVAGISKGDRSVSRQSSPFRAKHRRAAERRSELLFRHAYEPVEAWKCPVDRDWLKVGVCSGRRGSCIRANILANIATEHPIAELGSELHRNRPPLFDGLKRKTPWGANCVWGDDRAGRAAIDADRAATAITVQGHICFELQIEQQIAEHDPGTVSRHDQARVLTIPAESGTSGCRAIDDPGRINQEPSLHGPPGHALDRGVQ